MSDQNDEDSKGFNLTSFLFGNIDETGNLEDDVLDNESKKHLSCLAKFGLAPLLNELVNDVDVKVEDVAETVEIKVEKQENGDEDDPKSPSAIDYSDINELAEEPIEDIKKEPDDIKKEEVASDYDADDEGPDCKLMPPPPAPSDGVPSDHPRKRKLNTPLESLLPEKYADTDVTELFPDFRVDKTLRFSRLFGAGKQSLPHIWRSVKKRKKKRKNSTHKENSDSGSDNDFMSDRKRGWTFNYANYVPPENIVSDDEEKFMKPMESVTVSKNQSKEDNSENNGPKVADWRFGPAQLWYDMLDVPETGEGFDYGFAIKDKNDDKEFEEKEPYPEDAFLMVSQLHWEDDVVWNGDDIKHKVLQKLNSKTNAAGWLLSSANRTAQAFSQPGKGMPGVRIPTAFPPVRQPIKPVGVSGKAEGGGDDTWYSIFPVENEELVYGAWEKEVVWDPNAMETLPHPPILTLDPNDENIILGIPNDVDSAKQRLEPPTPAPKVKIPHPHVKKSKILLGKAGVINVLEEDSPPPPPKSPHTDPFNVSNDSYYMPKSSDTLLRLKVTGCNIMQHSTPVVELRTPFVQTHMGSVRLRNFHRPLLKRFSHGGLAHPGPHPVYPLAKQIRKKHKLREAERQASGGGDVFFMRTPEDLTGKDGEIVLVEFCEEHPPLISQVGMCSKVKNYYKRRAGKDTGPSEYKYGEVAFAHTSPFLGVMTPGTCIQTLENNMYRAPVYPHNILPSDFLVIRTRHQYFVREADSLFVAGQLCPLYEVPGPNSKRANNFVRDFLQVFIYRLFWKSNDTPKRIRMDEIRSAFPSHSESSIRKRLKLCADFKRTGTGTNGLCFIFSRDPHNPDFFRMDSNWWVIKPDFRLPTEEEIRAMVSPEQCCAYFSMIAAEQRLKDAGYGEKFLLTPVDDDDEELQLKMEDEVKVAPWNTTRAYIQAMKGKCLLQLTGPADPTGCGEGFSYVRIPNKPTQSKEEQESQPKRIVTGTDADLRRLSLNNAKALLRKYGVPEEEIKKLSRWEVIDVVRTLSTEKAKAGEEGMNKFSRGNRFSIAEHQERYKEECQRIFDLQNRVLASYEVLSTDEGESSDEDSSDIEEMGKNIENMLANKKTSTQLSLEKEEQERQELRKLIMGDSSDQDPKKPKDKKKEDEEQPSMTGGIIAQPGRILKIYRTFRDGEGKEYTRTEVVRKPAVIDMYCKIRSSKDEVFIRQYATMDENLKEEMKREKRRLQEQLRRIKRNQERTSDRPFMKPLLSQTSSSFSGLGPIKLREGSDSPPPVASKPISVTPPTPRRKKPSKLKPDLKLKCGACGQVGHMRTNKACPMYSGPDKPIETSGRVGPMPVSPAPSSIAMTEDQEEDFEKQIIPDDEDLVNIDGTKMKLSSKLLKHAEEMKKRALVVKVPKDALGRSKKRKAQELHCDYLKRHQRPANRRRTDPVVVLSTILESILNEMRDLPDVQPFLFPVNVKAVPDYYKIIHKPMDLQTIRDSLRMKKYQSREEFLADVNQIVENSKLYNGAKSVLTLAAKRMLDLCVDRLGDKEERLMRLEKAINPLLDDNDQVALTFILDNVVNNKLKVMSEAWPFARPVNKKNVKDYYTIIKEPMDLETVEKKVKSHKYHSRKAFLDDIEKILTNCVTYNGKDSPFTLQAETLYKVAKSTLEEYDEHLTTLEKSISLVQERALEQVEDSLSQWDDADASTIEQPGDLDLLDLKEEQETGVLEEDLQFSSEEELEEVTAGGLSPGGGSLGPVGVSSPGFGIDTLGVVSPSANPDDDSQQVAEAMVQLAGNITYYTPVEGDPQQGMDGDPQHEETMEVDPNYDPSEFLGGLKREKEAAEAAAKLGIQDDLAVSESDDENQLISIEPKAEEDDNELWF